LPLRLALLFLVLAIFPARAAMEDGLAITDPLILEKLERYDATAPRAHTYSIADLLFPSENRTPGPVSNDNLFKGPLKTATRRRPSPMAGTSRSASAPGC
jgi:hypothetical protein